MPSHIQGQGRSQVTLFPESLDDFVMEGNPVRVIDAFVDHLDLHSLGFQRLIVQPTGRPGILQCFSSSTFIATSTAFNHRGVWKRSSSQRRAHVANRASYT